MSRKLSRRRGLVRQVIARVAVAAAAAALLASCPLWPELARPICRAVASAVAGVSLTGVAP